ncbi:symmetrical bis(5'-nucleosyl)-tetraphosphatase [Alteromonas pelagimontana]|uniref:bis(5'-nucleosyl)-tetraphosphatase (symmetrical) n=1 Tax=Alteromonas pelagimontana TaxID=1858656 RepID=A0A6M4MBU3_9ALTE|nr:symmetrical bis(5'-nucleosyl)-tetraphosphatase [Alteromonas pelagimontana]QJR80278.1 symmetrical bis(5'-nucleosyl)-tetraphosphatase [Alteromonas pelagimontana]
MPESQTLVVGDIQGCYTGLMRLLEKANFDPKRDRLYAVGDLVARGEDSLETVKYLMELGDRFASVQGNHDLHLLAVALGIKNSKKKDKLGPLLSSKILPDIIDWFRQFPLALAIDDNHTLVHAGLYPGWSTSRLLAYSGEVSQVLQASNWKNLLSDMYGSSPRKWKDELTGTKRLRFIINAATRMRFLTDDRKLDFDSKGTPEETNKSLKPWFAIENPHLQTDEKIIFGHWAALNGKTQSSQFIALDTGYVWGQTMTALRLEDNAIIKVEAKG